jgi:hypothetical protein
VHYSYFSRQAHLNNSLYSFVQRTILTEQNIKIRAKKITLFIHVAKECINNPLPDYNSSGTIIAALQSQCISQLINTFKLVEEHSKIIFNALGKIFNPCGNFKSYRELQRAYQYVLPYLVVVAKDITYLKEGGFFQESLQPLGNFYSPFIALRSRLEFYSPTCTSDMYFQLMTTKILNDEELMELSSKAEADEGPKRTRAYSLFSLSDCTPQKPSEPFEKTPRRDSL